MVQLSLMEEVKDKASRLIPTAYMEIVEECTAPHLLIPTYEHVKFLCETVNRKPDVIVDVVRALRRRIADNDVAVKHLTVQLLESMIKNSVTAFHIEVASQKGLLRDLVNVACMQPTTGRAMQAKEAALLLTLNLSIWFRGHPSEECYILTTLADDVRNNLGPNCFEGIEPERNTRVRMQMSVPPPAASHSYPRIDPRAANTRSGAGNRGTSHRQEKRNLVDAIAIDLPTSERVSAMLDVCITFSEYLNNAEMSTDKPLTQDEVVESYLSQVRSDHDYVAVLLSSNLQLDRDVLRTVSDSQLAILKKVQGMSEGLAGHTAALQPTQSTTAAVPALQHTPVRTAGDTESQLQDTPSLSGAGITPYRTTPPHAVVAAGSGDAALRAAQPPQTPAPSVDDLFGDATEAPAIPPSNAAEVVLVTPTSSAAAVPETSSSGTMPVPPPPSLSPSFLTPSPATEAAPAVHTDPAVVRREGREELEEVHSERAEKEEDYQDTAAAEDKAKEEDEAPAISEAAEAPTPAPAVPTGVPPKDDDDFDAFLEGRTSA